MAFQVDITGKTYGKLTAVRRVHRNRFSQWIWEFLCTCGKRKFCVPSTLNQSAHPSCGRCQLKSGVKPKNLANRKVGFWTVLKRARPEAREVYYLCRCRCGLEREVKAKHLVHKKSLSCLSCAAKDHTIGAKLRRWRLRSKLTTRQVAALEGVTHQAIALREKCQRPAVGLSQRQDLPIERNFKCQLNSKLNAPADLP